ncbi:MAG: hypothetical protein FWD51_04160, partial [Betaproteobacteria bacterium]|nr:hypothetical protein [Betaproteobacteria bacterium]
MNIKYLFLIAVFAQITATVTGVALGVSELWFWLVIPLGIILAYVASGELTHQRNISNENFGDSCYYLGFIATIVSLAACLFDMRDSSLQLSIIAQRFGAALACTALGLIARLYYVGFKPNLVDAMDNAEENAISATRKLYRQLGETLSNMQNFNAQVGDASREALTRISSSADKAVTEVSSNITNMAEKHITEITKFLNELTQTNRESITRSITNIDVAGKKLTNSIDSYTEAVEKRLREGIVLPDDYFISMLEKPMDNLGVSIAQTTQKLMSLSESVTESVSSLRPALVEVRERSTDIGGALSHVIELAKEQEKLLANSKCQVETMGAIAQSLDSTRDEVDRMADAVWSQTEQLGKYVQFSQQQQSAMIVSIKAQGESLDKHIALSSKQYTEMSETVTSQAKEMSSYVSTNQQQQSDMAATLAAQGTALTEQIETSRKQYADTSATMLAQGEALAQNIDQQTRLSSAVAAQTEALAEQIDMSRKLQTEMSDMAIVQTRALTETIENSRQQQSEA